MNAQAVAEQLFQSYVGHRRPTCFSELLEIVTADGASVNLRADAPQGFTGILIENTISVNASPSIPDHKRLRILAHEYAHWLRRNVATTPRAVRLYGAERVRDIEEQIARAFERLF